MTRVLRRATLVAMVLLTGMLASGCNPKKPILPVTNLAPTVRLTASPIDTNAVCTPDAARSCYSLTLDWVGYDPDGRVDHFIYAVDPDNPDTSCHRSSPLDTCWIVTTDNEKRLVFPAPSKSPKADSLAIMRGYHVFVIAAVDNDGMIGPRAYRAFFSFTNAPTVSISNPRPTGISEKLLPPSIRISWKGTDDDGVFTTKPVRYKYILIGPGNEFTVLPNGFNDILGTFGMALQYYNAPDFPASKGWTTVGGDTTTVQFTNLIPGAHYAFAVVSFDEAGAYSPVSRFDTNVIRFTVGFAAAKGPVFTVFNESFFYHYLGSTYDPQNEVRIELPAGQPVTFNWFADPPPGADIRAYRWMLDGDVFDTRARSDELTDLSHWSSAALGTVTATVGPFSGGDHHFYIDCEDNTGFKALATIHFFVVVPSFDKELLILDDTRYRPDQFSGGGLIPPQGAWPGAAELDTFMYAVGHVPWQMYPAGSMSTPGIMTGYTYDTLGTRKTGLDLGVSLAKLGEYRHVVWLIDFNSATLGSTGSDPITALRFMSTSGHLNSLGAYVRMGGEAWLVGGGGAYATEIPWDVASNNGSGGSWIWSVIPPERRELAPGRFMYDVARWQSVIRDRNGLSLTATEGTTVNRALGRFRSNPGIYLNVPVSFDKKTLETDPVPPLRTELQYFQNSWTCEFINSDNTILEPVAGSAADLKIDSFNDATPGPVLARWISSDPANTVVDQVAVTPAVSSRASGKALEVRTQGGGASTGSFVDHDFGTNVRDWSGLAAVKIAVNQAVLPPAIQWRLRAIDVNGGTASAPLSPSAAGGFVDLTLAPSDFTTDPGSVRQPDFVRIQKLQLVLANGDVASQTDFDNIEITTLPEASVLDTLMAAQLNFNRDTLERPVSATMTVYHGHEFAKPFVFTGFTPWIFRRNQCQQLFDFVLQNLWGLPKNGTSLAAVRSAAFAPAHRNTGAAARPVVGLRQTRSGGGVSGGADMRRGAQPNGGLRSTGKP